MKLHYVSFTSWMQKTNIIILKYEIIYMVCSWLQMIHIFRFNDLHIYVS